MKTALVCIAKNEDNYILEWIAYHLRLGFDAIFIYQNNWNFPINVKGVHTLKFNGECQQLPAYNDFIEKYSRKFDWVAFLDVDEFIVLKKHAKIKAFLEDFNDLQGGLAVNWVMFGPNGHVDIKNENYSVLGRFTRCASRPNQHIKSILRIKRNSWLRMPFSFGRTKLRMVNPHHPNVAFFDTDRKKVEGPFNPGGAVNFIQINHYFTKSLAEFRLKLERGRADQPGLRDMSAFADESKGSNDIEDFTALNFYKK